MTATGSLLGVSFGSGTTYPWATYPASLLSTPDVRTDDQARPLQHGVIAGADLLGGRMLAFDLWVLATSLATVEQALADLAEVFQPSSGDVPLYASVSGTPADYVVYGRPRGVVVEDAPNKANSGVIRCRALFLCTDPRKYATPSDSAATSLATGSGGLTFAAIAPFVFGTAGTGNTMSCVNGGNIATPFVATFTGPLVAPALTATDQGYTLNLSGADLAVGDTLVIDSAEQTVLYNGVSRYSWLTSGSRWFNLLPGTNNLRLDGASGSGTVEVTWASAWV